jgi:hypothetical protein
MHVNAVLHSTCLQPAVTGVTTHGLPLVSVFCEALCRKAELGGPYHGRTLCGEHACGNGRYLLAHCSQQSACGASSVLLWCQREASQVLGKQLRKHHTPYIS